jgi:HSP20 family molecular chaperone IbpA
MSSQNISKRGASAEDIPQWPSLFSWPTFNPFHQIMLDSLRNNPWATLWNMQGTNVAIDEDDGHVRITTTLPGLDAALEDAELSLKDDVLVIDIPKKTMKEKHKH